ncbi:unnamed protein product [Notodromas monacha]|uniref:Calx-beta domain-containing protein n=1 Tax=Notodromas monacha TaxID=399045 RepID=A0A7R9GJQ4_9CRUS|nr:unnamed protein product [Notodromas monacha]CAG0923050.1 unnamed protein product [Notodromas monacha]
MDVKKYPGISNEDAAILAATKLVESQPKNLGWYRVAASRAMTGTRRRQPLLTEKLKLVHEAMKSHSEAVDVGNLEENAIEGDKAVIEFYAATCAVAESHGKFAVGIRRHGRTDIPVQVRVETIEGTATAVTDFVPVNKIVSFLPNETEQEVEVETVCDKQWEPDEEFYLKLSLLPLDAFAHDSVVLGRLSIMEITVVNDDDPGTLSFDKGCYVVRGTCGTTSIPVIRRNGVDGVVKVHYKTVEKSSAISGKDYIPQEGVLEFRHGETKLAINVPIINDFHPERNEHFEVQLFDVEGGASLGKLCSTIVTIVNDDDFEPVMKKMMSMTTENLEKLQLFHKASWVAQIREALNVNSGYIDTATPLDYLAHVFTFGWKVIFCLVPPVEIWGGWLAFFVSLTFLAMLTAVVGDCASIFGCLVGLSDEVTAIALVSAGTSLPDTFASMSAARQEKFADLAIGNVTGSNSVNVFLGLGLPWMIAAIYHGYHVREENSEFLPDLWHSV